MVIGRDELGREILPKKIAFGLSSCIIIDKKGRIEQNPFPVIGFFFGYIATPITVEHCNAYFLPLRIQV